VRELKERLSKLEGISNESTTVASRKLGRSKKPKGSQKNNQEDSSGESFPRGRQLLRTRCESAPEQTIMRQLGVNRPDASPAPPRPLSLKSPWAPRLSIGEDLGDIEEESPRASGDRNKRRSPFSSSSCTPTPAQQYGCGSGDSNRGGGDRGRSCEVPDSVIKGVRTELRELDTPPNPSLPIHLSDDLDCN
jgi:hypothetical protein